MAKTEAQFADDNQSGESSSNTTRDINPNSVRIDSARSKSKVDITIEPQLRSFSHRFHQKPPVEEIGTHVHMDDYSDLFPTLSLTRLQLKDPATRERLRDAINLGREVLLGRYALYSFSPVHAFLSKEQEKVFRHVLDALTKTLTYIWADSTQEHQALYMSESSYESFRALLESCRRIAVPHFRRLKSEVPPIPLWGADTTYMQYAFEANDFEILGACFRREVEYFLSKLASVYPGPYRQEQRLLPGGKEQEDPDEADSDDEDEVVGELTVGVQNVKIERSDSRMRDAPPHFKFTQHTAKGEFGVERGVSAPTPSDHPSISQHLAKDRTRQESTPISRGPTGLVRMFKRTSEGDDSRTARDADGRSGGPPLSPRNGSTQRSSPSGGDPDPDDSSSDNGGPPQPPRIPRRAPSQKRTTSNVLASQPRTQEAHFDFKLKMEIVPIWDGDTDTLARWVLRINDISKKSMTIRKQLGMVVPQRLTGDAERWYYSLPEHIRDNCETDWENIREVIGEFFMNRAWVEKNRKIALGMRYREAGYSRETPSQYFIRKRELLELVFDNSDSELITDIMAGAPLSWRTVLTPRLYHTTTDLQQAIRLHEDDLLELEQVFTPRPVTVRPNYSPYRARAHLVGWSKSLPPPKFPKDDGNISRKATPESKGARPCRHCGSGKHWDYECKYACQGTRLARANFVTQDSDDVDAQEASDALYYDDLSDSAAEDMDIDVEDEDMSPIHEVNTRTVRSESASTHHVGTFVVTSESPPRTVGQAVKQRLARIFASKSSGTAQPSPEPSSDAPPSLIELSRPMARPPGCSFLGARATTVMARLQDWNSSGVPIIVDTGSDITLISQKALNALPHPPRPRAGQKVRLVQVTGNATINGYVPLDLFFETAEGPVKLHVEAYVVKGMSTSFILGNDFAEQYSISLLRQGGETRVQFGDSGRQVIALDEVSSTELRDENGHTFQVETRTLTSAGDRAEARRKRLLWIRKREPRDSKVRALGSFTLDPGSARLIPVSVQFPNDADSVYVERLLLSPRDDAEFYGAPDSFVSRGCPSLHVANLTSVPVCIRRGQVLGFARNPKTWLDCAASYSSHQLGQASAHAALIRSLSGGFTTPVQAEMAKSEPVELRASARINSEEDPLAEDPLEGGPKTSEAPPEDTPSDMFLSSIDLPRTLNPVQRGALEGVLMKNRAAFSLDGKLGTVKSECTIPLRPGSKEVSLPPFPSSPAKREVIDKQMNSWIELSVIEPSVSPWGAPAFIVYRNGKPRMVVDYRKLNDLTIPDEFPLP